MASSLHGTAFVCSWQRPIYEAKHSLIISCDWTAAGYWNSLLVHDMLLAYDMECVDTEAEMYGLFPTMLVIHGVPSELVEVHAMAVNLSKSYLARKSCSNGWEMITSSVYNKIKCHQTIDSLRNSLLRVEYQWACDMLVSGEATQLEIFPWRFAHVGWLSSVIWCIAYLPKKVSNWVYTLTYDLWISINLFSACAVGGEKRQLS